MSDTAARAWRDSAARMRENAAAIDDQIQVLKERQKGYLYGAEYAEARAERDTDAKIYYHFDYDCSTMEPHECVGAGTARSDVLP